MRLAGLMIAVLIAGCDGTERAEDNAVQPDARPTEARMQAPRWELTSNGSAATLIYGAERIQLICPKPPGELLVNVPAFTPIGSEERLSFGGGGDVVALVADTAGDAVRGGVTGAGPVPDILPQLLTGEIAANYGAQNAGPYPQPPQELASAFVAACRAVGTDAPAPEPRTVDKVSACLVQNGARIAANRLKAIGTEPFWGARVEGRCVTYSTPEDQDGTRVWTQFEGSAERGTWTGFLGEQRFVMRTRPQPGCSDGMSDRRYPIAVTLTVSGEERRGCAEPLSAGQ